VLAKGSTVYPRYAYQEASEEMLDPIRKIEAICMLHGVPPGAAALQFSMRDPRIASTICGVTKPERVKRRVKLGALSDPDEAWAELNGAQLRDRRPRGDARLQARIAPMFETTVAGSLPSLCGSPSRKKLWPAGSSRARRLRRAGSTPPSSR